MSMRYNLSKLDYWQIRQIEEEQKTQDNATEKLVAINRAYTIAQNYLTSETSRLYHRYFSQETSEEYIDDVLNTRISPSELVTLKALADDISVKEDKDLVVRYLNQVSAKSRITRLDELQLKAYISAKQAGAVELKQNTDLYTEVINRAWKQAETESIIYQTRKDYDLYPKGNVPKVDVKKKQVKIVNPKTSKTVAKVDVTPDEPIKTVKKIPSEYVQKALDTQWKGARYSKRIWKNTDDLAKQLKELFTAREMSGMTEREMINRIQERFDVGRYKASRLIRTEANFFYNKTKLESWKQRNVKQYQLVAVLDNRTSKICRSIDGKIFDVSEATIGVNYPPFHPFCRTVATIYLKNSPYTGTRTARTADRSKEFQLNQTKNYRDWEKIVKGGNADA